MMHLRYLQIDIFKMKKIGNHQKKTHQLPFALKDLMSWAVDSSDMQKHQGDCSLSSLQLLLYTSTYLEPTSKKQMLLTGLKKNQVILQKMRSSHFGDENFSPGIFESILLGTITYPIKGHFWVNDFPNFYRLVG